MTEPVYPPQDVDPNKPSAARMYDYLLGGSTNWAVDRQAGDQALAAMPWVGDMARSNRAFLRRVVHYCIEEGIEQFVDLGSGIPTVGNVHQVANELNPNSRVVYVDNEAVAVAHGQLDLQNSGDPRRHQILQGDIRDAPYLWQSILNTEILDPKRPIAILSMAVLHFIPDSDNPQQALRYFREQVAPGSALALSHYTLDEICADRKASVDGLASQYGKSQNPLNDRSRAAVAEFFGDFELAEPGLVFGPQWRPDPNIAPELEVNFAAPSESMAHVGVGRKPAKR